MINAIDLFGKSYEASLCVEEDIDVHFEKIKDVIPKNEVQEFKQRMTKCISAGSAYKLSDNSCFLYYLNPKPFKAEGVALYGKNSPLKILALLNIVFTKLDTHTFKLEFHLHANKLVSEYRSLVTEASIKRQAIPGYPLVVRIDKLKDKILSIQKIKGFL